MLNAPGASTASGCLGCVPLAAAAGQSHRVRPTGSRAPAPVASTSYAPAVDPLGLRQWPIGTPLHNTDCGCHGTAPAARFVELKTPCGTALCFSCNTCCRWCPWQSSMSGSTPDHSAQTPGPDTGGGSQTARGLCCSPLCQQCSWTSALGSIQSRAPMEGGENGLTRTLTSMQTWAVQYAPCERTFLCSSRKTSTVRPLMPSAALCSPPRGKAAKKLQQLISS